jgi:hypothetical protein
MESDVLPDPAQVRLPGAIRHGRMRIFFRATSVAYI